jgi:large subunit ribosomal protein L6
MSRIGKQPITVPAKVAVTIDGQNVTVKGPKGELKHTLPSDISAAVEGTTLQLSRPTNQEGKPSSDSKHKALHGLTRALVQNMVTGVSTGFRRTLIIEGVGYQGEVQGKNLVMSLGYSHKITIEPPDNISFVAETRTLLHIDGIDKQQVGQVAANIRELRPPEPYLGKGVRYSDETIRRKAGKSEGKK